MLIRRKYLYFIGVIAILGMCFIAGCEYTNQNYIPVNNQIKPLNGVPILMYHKINPDRRSGGLGLRVPPQEFAWEMAYLKKNGYHTVDMGTVLNHYQNGAGIPKKPIIITFDDGYQDNYLYALPILKKNGFTATVFVITNTIGGFNDFDLKAKIEPKNKMMNWSEIRAMDANGITIGSHTLDHPHLTKITPSEAKRQIIESKKLLEKGLGKRVRYFCYPYGDVNPAIVQWVKESGYEAATTTKPGLASARLNPYLLNRIRITGHFNHQIFIQQLNKYHASTKTFV